MFSHLLATSRVALYIGALALITTCNANPLDLPVQQNLYPDPIEKALGRVRDPADKVLFAFRSAKQEHARSLSGNGLAQFLAKALDEHHRAVSWTFTREIERAHLAGDDGPAKELEGALSTLPVPADAAGYQHVLDRLPAALAPRFAAARANAQAQGAALADRAALDAYVQACAASPEFYRKTRLWTRAARLVRTGVDGLLDRLEDRVSAENLIRFFARVARGPLPRTARHAADAMTSMRARLVEAARTELSDFVAGGMGERTQSIDVLEGGHLRTSSVLLTPRLRQVSKRTQALADPAERMLFMPIFAEVDRWITGQLAGGRALDEAGRAYFTKVHSTLEFMLTWMKANARNAAPSAADPELDEVEKQVRACDAEGLFRD